MRSLAAVLTLLILIPVLLLTSFILSLHERSEQ